MLFRSLQKIQLALVREPDSLVNLARHLVGARRLRGAISLPASPGREQASGSMREILDTMLLMLADTMDCSLQSFVLALVVVEYSY